AELPPNKVNKRATAVHRRSRLLRGDEAIRTGQKASTTIPIIGSTGDNTTRVGLLAADLETKRQEVLAEFFPAAKKWGRPSIPKAAADALRSKGERRYRKRSFQPK